MLMISTTATRIARWTSLAAFALTAAPASPQDAIDSSAAFKRLTTLIGTWDVSERDNPNTKEIATYTFAGRGVLAEDLRAPGDAKASVMGHMYTAYHLDKGTLVMTHFCGAGNQPRMRVTSVTDGGRKISFQMYDITNLATAESFRSDAVDVIFLAEDRVDLVYHGSRGPGGSIKSEQVFQLRRRPSGR
jgi:hypothetical protein